MNLELRVYLLVMAILPWLGVSLEAAAPSGPSGEESADKIYEGRIVTRDEVREATSPLWIWPVRAANLPFEAVEQGLRWPVRWAEGAFLKQRVFGDGAEQPRLEFEILPPWGGEGAGLGGGAALQWNLAKDQHLRTAGTITTRNYQYLAAGWEAPLAPATRLRLSSTYTWSPQDDFYGLGNTSSDGFRTDFGLRHGWLEARVETRPVRLLRFGASQRLSWFDLEEGTDDAVTSAADAFAGLAAPRSHALNSLGGYLVVGTEDEGHDWGATVYLATQFHRNSDLDLRFYSSDAAARARIPVRGNSSLLVEHRLSAVRPNSGSAPVPFYLLPRLGGASLRGFAPHRFYGSHAWAQTVEYRYRIHPNIQTALFWDYGQVADGFSGLAWDRGHSAGGVAFGFGKGSRTFLRLALAGSREGFRVHLGMGDPVFAPLSPVSGLGGDWK